MTREILKRSTAAVFALGLLAAPALAQGMMDWDSNADGMFSQDEFNTGFTENGAFTSWDPDADGTLDENEFSSGFGDNDVGAFGDWDSSGDGLIDQDEWNAGNFGRYDADGSGMIEEPEFGQPNDDMGDGGLFDI